MKRMKEMKTMGLNTKTQRREVFYLNFLCAFVPLCLIILLLSSCRDDEVIFSSETIPTGEPDFSFIQGFYLLNEGNMGSNNATLDYYNFQDGNYRRNIYAEANPDVVKELGDVGNDLQVYGNKLYAVINVSNKVEVMDAGTTRRIARIAVPNCRYVTFYGGKAYVSAYAAPVGMNPEAGKGCVLELDTATLQITRSVTVGYQPEEMAIYNHKLYVANSGGYRKPNYDRTVSVVDLNSFTPVKTIDVAINLHRMKVDRHGTLYVSSRGDEEKIPSNLFTIDTNLDEVTGSLNIETQNLTIDGDSIYILGNGNYTRYNIQSKQIETNLFISDGTEKQIRRPYGIIVHPVSKNIYITDARVYTSSGTLYEFDASGQKKWEVKTGDIPAVIAFVGTAPASGTLIPEDRSAYIHKVFEYRPAPGQFINEMPEYEEGDNAENMRIKAENLLKENKLVSLGGYGGYVVVGFDHAIQNIPGKSDFKVYGNAYYTYTGNDRLGGNSEPGIIYVSRDVNRNGIPDDPWYEIAGSEYNKPATIKNYEITYRRPEPLDADCSWTDNQGNSGVVLRNTFHKGASYFPLWLQDTELTYKGTLLPANAIYEAVVKQWILYAYEWGYADNHPNDSELTHIDIDWAVDKSGNPVHLPHIDFVKVCTGVNQSIRGSVGEFSTELGGIKDLSINE